MPPDSRAPRSRPCIAAHDAGGAEILSSYVRQHDMDCLFLLDGPAVDIFRRKLGAIELVAAPEAIERSDWLLCGTSWQSDLELTAIDLARAAGKRSVAFLDHWVNYPDRFVRGGVERLPDEIWVGDDDAETLARQVFPAVPVRCVPNPFFIDLRREIAEADANAPRKESAAQSVLFVCEPLSEHGRLQYGDERHWGYTEFEAIEYFFQHAPALGVPIGSVVIRPHPSESPGKYTDIVARHSALARVSVARTLMEDIADADIVVGCESMALVIALQAGRRVVSCIPVEGMYPSLPVGGIQHLSDLVAIASR